MTTKTAGQIAANLSMSGARSTGRKAHGEPTQEHKQRVQDLFIMLDQTYPFWLYGKSDDEKDEIKRTWTHMLRRFNDNQVEKALKICLKRIDDKRGPVLAKFLSLCEIPMAHRNYNTSRGLPAPEKITESVGRSALDKLKRKLNIK